MGGQLGGCGGCPKTAGLKLRDGWESRVGVDWTGLGWDAYREQKAERRYTPRVVWLRVLVCCVD
jgi:hypothetical protein